MATASNTRLRWNEPGIAASEVTIEALPFPAALLDSDGNIAAANREWLAAHPDAVPSRSSLEWSETIRESAPGLSAALAPVIRRVLEMRQKQSSEDYIESGRRRRVVVSAAAPGALVIDQDLGANLESPDDDQRRLSQKMETVGRLTGGVAHDFANLLTMIAGYSDLLLGRIGERDPIRPELDEIRKAANRGGRLIAQLLGFTRGRGIEPTVVDLNAVVVDMQRMMRPLIGEYVELQTALSTNPGKVVADPGQIEQVVMNLVLNARDAMPAGGRITIKTAEAEIGPEEARTHGIRPGPFVLLTVSDTGEGIDAASQAHLFEPFYTTKKNGKGTGLGLSTVQSIVKQGGGDVLVHSTAGEGAHFTIRLPRARAVADDGEVAAAARTSPKGSETVLLVEDEDGVRRLLGHVLHRWGYKVIEAPNGEDALAIFQERGDEIQLVLTDMLMPKMGGRTLAGRLQEIRPGLPIVCMSGYTDDVLARTGALGPGMSFLQKPLRPEVLASKVREALDSASRPFNPR